MSRARIASCVAVALCAAACGQPGKPPMRDGSPCAATRFDPPFTGTDSCSVDAVLTAAVTAIFTYRPAEQADATEVFHSAATLMAPDYLQRVGDSTDELAAITATEWRQWAANGTRVTAVARITNDDHPTDTSTRAARVVAVTQRFSITSSRTLTVYAQAARDSTQSSWLVNSLEVR